MKIQFEDQYMTMHGRHFYANSASVDDVAFIAANLREADRLEVERCFPDSTESVLMNSLNRSIVAWTAYRQTDGTPVAMWGVCALPADDRIGIPWLLGTNLISESYGDFMFLSRHYDQIMSRYFNILCNMIDIEYTQAQRWLSWLGYKKGNIVKSDKGFDFVLMYKDTSNVR